MPRPVVRRPPLPHRPVRHGRPGPGPPPGTGAGHSAGPYDRARHPPLRPRRVRAPAGAAPRRTRLRGPRAAPGRHHLLGARPVGHGGLRRLGHLVVDLDPRVRRLRRPAPGRTRRTHGAARSGRRHARPALLRLLLHRRHPATGGIRREPARLRRCHARPRPRRRPDLALCVLGADHGLLLPADRIRQRTAAQPPLRPPGAHRHHARRTRHAGRLSDHRPGIGHLPHLRDPRRPARREPRRLRGRGADPVRGPVEIGDLAVQPLAPERHGRAHPRQRLSARRGHGQGRRLSRRPARPGLRRRTRLAARRDDPRRRDDAARRLAGPAAPRPEARPRLRHRQPARLSHPARRLSATATRRWPQAS